MQQFTHDGGDNRHGGEAAVEQALGKGVQNGIMAFGNDGRQVKGGTQGGFAGFGNGGFLTDRGAGLMMSGIEASKGDELANIGERGQRGQLAEQLSGGEGTQARNGIDEVALLTQVRMLVDMVLQGALHLGDLVGHQRQLGLELADDHARQAGLVAQAIGQLLARFLQVGQVAHQALQLADFRRRRRPRLGLLGAAMSWASSLSVLLRRN